MTDIKNILRKLKWVVLPILVLLIGMTSVKMIKTTDNGVVLRLGKYHTILQPGLHLVIPFIDKVYNVPVTIVQKEEFGFRTSNLGERSTWENNLVLESSMLTGDLNILNVEWVVQYRIVDPKAWLFNVYENERENTIRDVSRATINSLVGDRAILDIMGEERNNIQAFAKTIMNEKYEGLGLGISVSSVQLQNVTPPLAVQEAFEDVNIAIQDMNRLINEGKEAYNREIPKTKGEADQWLQQAQGYAAERINVAEGDVARFNLVYAEYIKSPVITKRRLYLETVSDIFEDSEKLTIVDKNLKNFLPFKDIK